MSNVTQLNRAPIILQNFFLNCIGTHDGRQLVDVVITDSFIKEMIGDDKGRTRTIDRLPAYDINFVFDNQKYRTFRVPVKHWDKALKTMNRMASITDGSFVFEKGEQDPREQILVPTMQTHFYKQAVVMQDLGLDWPVANLMNNAEWEASLEGITDGELAAIELRFDKLGKMLSESLHKVKANLNVIANDNTIVRDHNLYYSTFIDFEKRQLAVSLTRMGYKLTGNATDDFQLTPHALEVEHWDEIFTSENSQMALSRLSRLFANFNQYSLDNFQTSETNNPLRLFAIQHLFAKMWGQIMPMSEPVYSMSAEALQPQIDLVKEDILKKTLDSCANPGLDLNSWKVYDYTNADEPTMVLEIGVELYKTYRNEFVDLVYTQLLESRHTLLRPHTGSKTVITDPAEIAARPIGDVQMERF